jgi:hypothetical protein
MALAGYREREIWTFGKLPPCQPVSKLSAAANVAVMSAGCVRTIGTGLGQEPVITTMHATVVVPVCPAVFATPKNRQKSDGIRQHYFVRGGGEHGQAARSSDYY